MKCEKCGHNDATIHYVEVINGIKTEHNLCSDCAREMDFGHYSSMFETEYPIGQILSGLLGIPFNSVKDGRSKMDVESLTCPTCHTPYQEFIEKSRFGCPDCYRVYDLLIAGNIKKLHGSDSHVGKRPKHGFTPNISPSEKPNDLAEQLTLLSLKLKEAIDEEQYEQAALYRDEIKALKERMETGNEMV